MGIDIYAEWRGQSEEGRRKQSASWLSIHAGDVGYLREAYHGGPYATRFLFAEAFETGRASISAAVLKERLPKALELVEERQRNVYPDDGPAETESAKAGFRAFVALCDWAEAETGKPVSIVASY